jgi:hypothetical protein
MQLMTASLLTVLCAASLLALAVGSGEVPTSGVCRSIVDRVDCSSGVGSSKEEHKLTRDQCETRGCCYDGSKSTSCYYAAEGETIRTIHMINSNHFDAGYANFTTSVVNEYFDTFFPRAANVGQALRSKKYVGQPGAGPLKWMTFSWLISLFFDCPPGMGLHCPGSSAMENISNAIRAGDITWPAFPFNAELATGDKAMIEFGVRLSHNIAKRFDVSVPRVLSTRDVPGMPRASLNILKAAGVTGLSEGMNGRMVPVNVPPAFLWKSLDGKTNMPTLWHWHGYGRIGQPGNPIRVPGSDDALCYCWRQDNTGPPMDAQEVLNNAKGLVTSFGSRARVISSTLDEYMDAIRNDGALQVLPQITTDLSDTWIWGVGSDPVKVSQMRSLNRARTVCEADNKPAYCGVDDKDYYNFSRLAIKNMEHTWGVSVFHYGNESDKDWSNQDFHLQLQRQQSNFMMMRESWVEQRKYGIDYPLEALPETHPVAVLARKDIADTKSPIAPDPEHDKGFNNITSAMHSPLQVGGFNITFGKDGSLSRLVNAKDGVVWSGKGSTESKAFLGLFRYQTLVLDDFLQWQSEYLINGSGGQNEYGKPKSFMKAVPTPTHQLVSPAMDELWVNEDNGTVLMKASFESPSLWLNYGAPHEIWVRYHFPANSPGSISCRLLLVAKNATRMPEAGYFSFNPQIGGKWSHSILGEWSDPNDIAEGASRGLHYVDDNGVRVDGPNGRSIEIKTLDAGLLRWGEPLPFPTPLAEHVDTSIGPSFCLHNNIWNTNYPDWMPFDKNGNKMNLAFRFEIELMDEVAQK